MVVQDSIETRNMTPEQLFGQVVSTMRIERRLSQKALALDARVDQSHLAGIERGRRAPPRKTVMTRLCAALAPSDAELSTLLRAVALTRLAWELREDRDFVEAVVDCALRRDPTLRNNTNVDHRTTT